VTLEDFDGGENAIEVLLRIQCRGKLYCANIALLPKNCITLLLFMESNALHNAYNLSAALNAILDFRRIGSSTLFEVYIFAYFNT